MEQRMYIGSTYYPEHWPKERWPVDVRLMKEAGVNVLRLADMAWAQLEPQDGNFEFGWLDEFIALLSDEDIQVVLATPTEASPVWLRHKHPEVVKEDQFGRIHAERGHHCHNRAVFSCMSGGWWRKWPSTMRIIRP